MPDWIGTGTKLLGALGQFVLKRWLFRAQFLRATREVYISEHGDSPYVSVWVTVRVHNRNHASTTIYLRDLAVQFPDGSTDKLDSYTVTEAGQSLLSGFNQEGNQYDIGGSRTRDLSFWARRYNPDATLLNQYQDKAPLEIIMELDQTFGSHVKLTGPLAFAGTRRQ